MRETQIIRSIAMRNLPHLVPLLLATVIVSGCGPTAEETRLKGELDSATASYQKLQKELAEIKQSDARRFAEIVAWRLAGDLAKAKEAMEGFMTQYPKSDLLGKAREVVAAIDKEIAKKEADEADRKRKVAEAEAEAKKKQIAEAEAKKKQIAEALSSMKASVDEARNLYFWQHKKQSEFIESDLLKPFPKPGIFPYIGKNGKDGAHYLMLYCRGMDTEYNGLADITLRSGEKTMTFESFRGTTDGFKKYGSVYIMGVHLSLDADKIKFLRDFSTADKVGIHFGTSGNGKMDSSYNLKESQQIVQEVLTAYDVLRSEK